MIHLIKILKYKILLYPTLMNASKKNFKQLNKTN